MESACFLLKMFQSMKPLNSAWFARLFLTFYLLLLAHSGLATGTVGKILPGHVPAVVMGLNPAGSLPATNELRLAMGLPLRNQADLQTLIHDLYDPESSRYHQYLSADQFKNRFSPTDQQYQSVQDFARTNGLKIVATHPHQLLLEVSGTVRDIERAFRLQLKTYPHPREARTFYAPATDPSVDQSLPVIDIQGLTDYVRPHPKLKRNPLVETRLKGNIGSAPDGASYMGDDFRKAYLPDSILTGAGQAVGMLEFDGYYPADIAAYAQITGGGRSNIALETVLTDSYNGAPTTNGNDEVSLDIEMAMAMAPGLSKIVVFESDPNSGLPNSILAAMVSRTDIKQFSCSWGWYVANNATTDAYFQTMAAQGQSFFNASGDTDAYTTGSTSVNGVDNTSLPNAPSSSPYITQVGGTTLTMNGTAGSYASETVWNWGGGQGSSGGISSYYTIPNWQTNIAMASRGGSPTQRNIPDVALCADNIYIISGGNQTGTGGYGGTSCAAPMWAGIMAMANQQAVSKGKPSVGFVNPALYAIASGPNYTNCFHDVIAGNNTWRHSRSLFYATQGYDLCTGLGTPAGQGLINALVPPTPLIIYGAGLTTAGPVGGPFNPSVQTLLLSNTSQQSIAWSLSSTSSWLNVSFTNGVLSGGKSTNIAMSLNGPVKSMPAGMYSSLILFTDPTNQTSWPLTFVLQIGQSALQNGGFETGDFSGWTLNGDGGSGANVTNGVVSATYTDSIGDNYVHSGSWGAALGQYGSVATLTQTIPTAIGQRYLLSLWLENPTNLTKEVFAVSWGGTNIYSVTNPPQFGWSNYTWVVTASTTNTLLRFTAENDQDYFGLDDISLIPVPAPNVTSLNRSTTGISFGWNTLAGIGYQVQSTTNLLNPVWQVVSNFTAGGVTATFTNSPGTDRQHFYRVRSLP